MANDNAVPSNIYTVLTLIALIALLAGVIFLMVRSNDLFGSPMPMNAEQLSALMPVGMQGLLG